MLTAVALPRSADRCSRIRVVRPAGRGRRAVLVAQPRPAVGSDDQQVERTGGGERAAARVADVDRVEGDRAVVEGGVAADAARDDGEADDARRPQQGPRPLRLGLAAARRGRGGRRGGPAGAPPGGGAAAHRGPRGRGFGRAALGRPGAVRGGLPGMRLRAGPGRYGAGLVVLRLRGQVRPGGRRRLRRLQPQLVGAGDRVEHPLVGRVDVPGTLRVHGRSGPPSAVGRIAHISSSVLAAEASVGCRPLVRGARRRARGGGGGRGRGRVRGGR